MRFHLQEKFGRSVVPLQFPIGKEENFNGIVNVITKKVRLYDKKGNIKIVDAPLELLDKIDEYNQIIMEAVAETSEELLEKYFEEGTLSFDEIYDGLIKGCVSGDIAPVMCGSASKVIGMDAFIEDVIKCFPSPRFALKQKAINIKSNEKEFISYDENKPFSALVL